MRKSIIVIAAILFILPTVLTSFTTVVLAEDYPAKDIRWILGGKPGGGFDTYARTIASAMENYLPKGVNVIVENKPGAGHRIAMSSVYHAEADGYTMGMPMMAGLFIQQMYEKQRYDMTKVDWLGMILHDPRVLAVPSDSQYKNVEDLQNAKDLRVPINGFASEADVILANESINIEAKYIAGHKNSNEAVLASLRGDADAVVFTYGSLRDYIRDGQLRPLALYGSDERISEIPETPTLAELGQPDLNKIIGNFRVIAGPPNIPIERLSYLREVIWKAMNDPKCQEKLEKANREINPKDGETTQQIMDELMQQYLEVKKELKPYYDREN
ncbi:MAG: tripartite tricarboxylate transporter substrate binding protein [Desulfobacteraceae bacterium]|nr:tripartite tricarboxylate transporter substrate binding protein [Desulfobacteraceae bacterium]